MYFVASIADCIGAVVCKTTKLRKVDLEGTASLKVKVMIDRMCTAKYLKSPI